MNLTKEYLVTVSTPELREMADRCGLFLPLDFDRRFIISELLDFAAEQARSSESVSLLDLEIVPEEPPLPNSYNVTEISVLIRDPMWLFVFWDFHQEFFDTIINHAQFRTFVLRVHSLTPSPCCTAFDFFDIEVSRNDRSKYIYLSFEDSCTMVELGVKMMSGKVNVLAKSAIVTLPRPNLPKNLCISQNDASKVALFSGLKEIKTFHFTHYRQAFRAR